MSKTNVRLLVEAGYPNWEDHREKTAFAGKTGWWLKQNILGNAGVGNEEAEFAYTYPQLFGQWPKIKKGQERPFASNPFRDAPGGVPLLVLSDESATERLGVNSVAKYHGHIEQRGDRMVGATYSPESILQKPSLLPLAVKEVSNLLEAAEHPEVLKRPVVVKGAMPNMAGVTEAVFDLEWEYTKAVSAKKATKKKPAVEARAAVSGGVNVVGIATQEGKSYSSYDVDAGVRVLGASMAEGIRLIGHNIINADLPKLRERYGIVPRSFGPAHIIDTMVVAHLIHPHWSGLGLFGLEDLVRFYNPTSAWKEDKGDLLGYNGYDTAYNFRLWKGLEIDLGLTDQWHLVEKDQRLAHMANLMRIRGMRIDSEAIRHFQREWAEHRSDIKAGLPFNPQSPPQVKAWFKERKYNLVKTGYDKVVQMLRAKSKYAKEWTRVGPDGSLVLVEGFDERELKPNDRVLFDLIQFKDEGKGVASWFDEIAIERGRIHPKFNVTGTAVARFSSSEPNAQNIPPEYRRFVLAQSDDEFLASFDGKNIEGRTVAWHAGAKSMLAAMAAGMDYHTHNASGIFKVPMSAVTKPMRQAGKMTSHATNYRETVRSLAGRLYGTVSDAALAKAQQLQDGYFAANPEIRQWHNRLEHQMASGDYKVVNGHGRMRMVYDLNDHERTKRAAHFLGCSDGADVVNQRALDVWDETGLIPQSIVHDELLYSLPKGDEGEKLVVRIREILDSPIRALDNFVIPFGFANGQANYGKHSVANPGGLHEEE